MTLSSDDLKRIATGSIIKAFNEPPSGDLSGDYPNPTVVAIQGKPIEGGTPANGDGLLFNSVSGRWEHSPITPSGGSPTGPAGGDLAGLYPDPTIAAEAITDAQVATANKDGLANVPSLRTLGTGGTQACAGDDARLTNARTPTGSAGGDLTGTYPNPTIANLQGNPIAASTPNIGEGVIWNGTTWVPTQIMNEAFRLKLGNVLVVDAINGNDSTGSVNGRPFQSIEPAINYINDHSLTNTLIYVFPGTYNLIASIQIPDTCAIHGADLQVCRIIHTATFTTTMITMGENSRIENFTISMTSTSDTADLTLITLPGTTAITSKIRSCVLNLDNSTVSTGSITNVYGYHVLGEGILGPATFSFNQTRSTTLTLRSNGGGKKFGVCLPNTSLGAQISFRDSNIYVAEPRDPDSIGVYIGVCCENPNSQVQIRTSSISGVPYKSSPTNPKAKILSLINLTLTGFQVIQGVPLTTGDRVLAAGQGEETENGLWIVRSTSWIRPLDMLTGSNASGSWVQIEAGDHSQQKWLCTSYPAIVDTDALNWHHTYTGVDIKLPVKARYTGGSPTGPRLTQGEYTPEEGDRLFLDQASNPVENGIYTYNSTGAWVRTGDLPAGVNSLNAYILIEMGTDLGKAYICTTSGTVGIQSLTFVRKYTGSDILQVQPLTANTDNGIILGRGTELITKSTGGKPFTSSATPLTLIYGYRGNIPSGVRYLWQGLQTTLDTTMVFFRLQQATVIQGISIYTRNTDLETKILTATVLKSLSGDVGSGIETPIRVSITDGLTQAESYTNAIEMERGTFLALRLSATGSISPGDFTVELDAYT